MDFVLLCAPSQSVSSRSNPVPRRAVREFAAAAHESFSNIGASSGRSSGRCFILVPGIIAPLLAMKRRSRFTRIGQRGQRRVASRRAQNVLERQSLEAGARLLEEAVRASQETSQPTQFSQQSEKKNRQSYVSQQAAEQGDEDATAFDEDGLPLVYSVDLISTYWDDRGGELAERWSKFLRISTPLITRFFYSLLNNRLVEDEEGLASTAVDNLVELGPTFVKLGQVLSIRPDILPEVTMRELSRLQDNVKPFSDTEARTLIEKELGRPVDEMFSSFTTEAVAAASLAQVYRATLRDTGEEVAVKVQRPGALGIVSKDLYVLRRLADVTQPLIRRFTADATDYIALTETFAEGLYTELDFRNEALNAIKMDELMTEYLKPEVREQLVIPMPLLDLTTRRVMLSKWVPGVKLSTLPAQEVQDFIKIGQEVFLTQLLTIGFFHGDPHPGNLLKIVDGPDAGKLCLLDFGLVAQVPVRDRDLIVSAVVHLGTENWDGLISDFIELGFLSPEVDRGFLNGLLQRVLTPYLKGGGANSMRGMNFQALSQDLIKLNLEVAFSIPPYVSLLARSVATLEGIALQGDPQYQIVAQAYPFVVRKLLKNDSRQSFTALRELLFDTSTQRLQPQRLSAMLQASLGVIAETERVGFIDFDSVPENGAPMSEVVDFLLSEQATNLRPLLNAEFAYGLDLAFRRASRQLRMAVRDALQPRIPFLGVRLPAPPPPPLLVPAEFGFRLMGVEDVLDQALPPLSVSEDLDLNTISQTSEGILFGDSGISFDDLQESPVTLVNAIVEALTSSSHSDSGVTQLSQVLQKILTGPRSREVLTGDVLTVVAGDLLQTWRERLSDSE